MPLDPTNFKLHEDSGHGWLEVKKDLLVKLGISNDISIFSYMKGDKAYLEEDGDLSVFIKALENLGYTRVQLMTFLNSVPRFHTNEASVIRSYESYSNS